MRIARWAGPCPGHLRAAGQLRERAAELADVFRRLLGKKIQHARSDHLDQRELAGCEVGVPDGSDGQARNLTVGRRWNSLRHGARRSRLCPGRPDGASHLALPAATSGGHSSLLRTGESWTGYPGRQGFSGDTRRPRDRAGCENRKCRLGCRRRRLSNRKQLYGRAAGGERLDRDWHFWRRVRSARIHRRLRCRDRQAQVAVQHRPRTGRARKRNLGRRFVENWRSAGVEYGDVRSGDQPDFLADGQSFALESRRGTRRRQSLQQLAAGAERRHGKDELVFPVHQARRARLGCDARCR